MAFTLVSSYRAASSTTPPRIQFRIYSILYQLAHSETKGGAALVPRKTRNPGGGSLPSRVGWIPVSTMAAPIHPIWQKHPGLVWSNRLASDSVRLRAALCRPRFDQLLDLAVAFGLDRLRAEWAVLEAEADELPEVRRSAALVARILKNIEEGFRRADS